MNKNTFNPVRFMHCLRKDWTENRARYIYYFLFAYVILTIAFFLIDYARTESVIQVKVEKEHHQIIQELGENGHDLISMVLVSITSVVLNLFLAYTGSTFFRASRHRQGLIADLTLPVSDAEKFAVRWLRTAFLSVLLFALAVVLADFTRVGLVRHICPDTNLSHPIDWLKYFRNSLLPSNMLEAYAIQALFILGATYWHKRPFNNTFAFVFLLSVFYYAVFAWISFSFIDKESLKDFYQQARLNDWWLGLNVFLLVFGYVMSYLRMRRISLIVSWKDRTSLALLAVAVAGLILCCWIPFDTAARLTAQ